MNYIRGFSRRLKYNIFSGNGYRSSDGDPITIKIEKENLINLKAESMDYLSYLNFRRKKCVYMLLCCCWSERSWVSSRTDRQTQGHSQRQTLNENIIHRSASRARACGRGWRLTIACMHACIGNY